MHTVESKWELPHIQHSADAIGILPYTSHENVLSRPSLIAATAAALLSNRSGMPIVICGESNGTGERMQDRLVMGMGVSERRTTLLPPRR